MTEPSKTMTLDDALRLITLRVDEGREHGEQCRLRFEDYAECDCILAEVDQAWGYIHARLAEAQQHQQGRWHSSLCPICRGGGHPDSDATAVCACESNIEERMVALESKVEQLTGENTRLTQENELGWTQANQRLAQVEILRTSLGEKEEQVEQLRTALEHARNFLTPGMNSAIREIESALQQPSQPGESI